MPRQQTNNCALFHFTKTKQRPNRINKEQTKENTKSTEVQLLIGTNLYGARQVHVISKNHFCVRLCEFALTERDQTTYLTFLTRCLGICVIVTVKNVYTT